MSKRHQVIQLHPTQYDFITCLLSAEKVEDFYPRAKWEQPKGIPLGYSHLARG